MSKWEDTVMTKTQIELFEYVEVTDYPKYHQGSLAIAQAQAKVSFKAGQLDGYEKGIREVVEWIEETSGHIERTGKKERMRHYCPNCDNSVIGVLPDDWQAKLKEWGVSLAPSE